MAILASKTVASTFLYLSHSGRVQRMLGKLSQQEKCHCSFILPTWQVKTVTDRRTDIS